MNTLAIFLSSRVKAEVLRLLFGVANRELHVRELGRQTHLAVSTVRQELKRLASIGIIVSRRDGNRMYYRANASHPLYPDIHNMVLKTSGLFEVLQQALQHPGIQLAFVFGSLAAGSEKAHSDVDVMVIGKVSFGEVVAALQPAQRTIGREVNPHVFKAAEFARRKKAEDHFLNTVLAAPKLFVIGDQNELAGLGK
ncbi:MAG: nucleotidyltransferase domain-containing protein [Planctomycetota bacterium]